MSEYDRSGYRGADQILQWGKAYCDWIETCFDRADKLKPCPAGARGACCKHCHMGPCRFIQGSEERVERGVCGATLATVAARNILRMAVTGAALHTERAREMAFTLLGIAMGEISDVAVSDIKKLHRVAGVLEIEVEGRSLKDVTAAVAESLIDDIGRQRGLLSHLKKAPKGTRERWEKWGILPRGVDREIAEALCRTHVGVDSEPDSLLLGALKVSLADGWGGSMIAADISDILFGDTPPLQYEEGFGIFREDEVNLLLIGHEPTFAKAMADVASDPGMIEYARSAGANGINVGSIHGTRPGMSSAGGFTNQELCIMTGIVDAVIVGHQSIMPTLEEVANSFHTKIVTTSSRAHLPAAYHMSYDAGRARETAGEIIRLAVDNYPNRSGSGKKVAEKKRALAGFSCGHMGSMNGGAPGASVRLINDAVSKGKIRGVVGLLGSDSARVQSTGIYQYLAAELIADDVLVLSSGSGSASCAMEGLLTPEVALEKAGPGLKETCEAMGIPPVLNLGSGIDNSRILTLLSDMTVEGGLSEEIGGMPLVIIAPEWFSEEDITWGCCFAASGIPVILGGTSPVEASDEVGQIMTETWFERFRGSLCFEPDFEKMHGLALEFIDKAREESKLQRYEYGKLGG